MLFRISVHQEPAAAKRLGVWFRLEPQNIRPVIRAISWQSADPPLSTGDGAYLGDILHARIILARARPGISGANMVAILLKFSGLLRVSPRERFQLGDGLLWKKCGDSRPRLSGRRSLARRAGRRLDRFVLLLAHMPSIEGCKPRSKVM